MSEAPKLYTNKPKKAQLKQVQEQLKGKYFASSTPPPLSASSAAATSYKMGSGSSPPPPQPPKESFARRYKFLWPLLLTVNLAIGAYFFTRTKGKDTSITEEEGPKDVTTTPVSAATATTAPITEKPLTSPSITEAAKLPEPIPVNQQHELFKWILEEKRKVKPKDPEEKQRIDEEKAILKQFIRAKSVPTI